MKVLSMKVLSMKRMCSILLLLVTAFLLSGCDENSKTIVDVKYNISSISYDCDSDLDLL